jgi:hypothetical protein
MKPFRTLTVALLAFSFTLTGCFGKFALTRKVYNFNAEIGDKFLRSIVLWVFIVLPVYSIAAFIDFIAFNLIEFWTGNNPVDSGKLGSVEKDGTVLTANRSGDKLEFVASQNGIVMHRVVFQKTAGAVLDAKVFQADGKLLDQTAVSNGASAEELAFLQTAAL